MRHWVNRACTILWLFLMPFLTKCHILHFFPHCHKIATSTSSLYGNSRYHHHHHLQEYHPCPQHPCDGGDHQLELPRTPHTLDAQLDTGDHDDYQVDQEYPGAVDHRHFDAPWWWPDLHHFGGKYKDEQVVFIKYLPIFLFMRRPKKTRLRWMMEMQVIIAAITIIIIIVTINIVRRPSSTNLITIIWVSFCRAGILAISCHIFSKSRTFVWPNRKR